MKLPARTLALLLAASAVGAGVFGIVKLFPPIGRQDLSPVDRSRYALHIRREEAPTPQGLVGFTGIVAEIAAVALVARRLGLSINRRPRRRTGV